MSANMRIVAFSLLVASAQSECTTSSTGCPTCKCIGQHRTNFPDVDCTYAFAYNGKCISIDELTGKGLNWTMYPANYGEACGKHMEPAQNDCASNHVHPPVELPATRQADWCKRKWCYVDGCKCDTGDATKSSYFTIGVKPYDYSYATCGDLDTYTADKTNTKIGDNNCPSTADDASDAPFRGPLASLLALALLVPTMLLRN